MQSSWTFSQKRAHVCIHASMYVVKCMHACVHICMHVYAQQQLCVCVEGDWRGGMVCSKGQYMSCSHKELQVCSETPGVRSPPKSRNSGLRSNSDLLWNVNRSWQRHLHNTGLVCLFNFLKRDNLVMWRRWKRAITLRVVGGLPPDPSWQNADTKMKKKAAHWQHK